MSKSRKDRHGLTRDQRLLNEINELRRDNSKLRKMLSRTENRISDKDEILEQNQESSELIRNNDLEILQKRWECKVCHNGYLEITKYFKIDKEFYFRKCNICANRTKGKPFNGNVKGLFKQKF